jgi:hypothetical protein
MIDRLRYLAVAGVLAALIPGVWHRAEAAECSFDSWRTYRNAELRRTADGHAYFWITSRTAIDADGAPTAYHPDDVGDPCGASGAGLDCPANAGYPTKTWWPSVLAKDPANPTKAFVQPSGPGKGFFVSKTALFDSGNANERDPNRYVDASTISYVVFPGPFFELSGTGLKGDLGVAYHLVTKRMTAFVVGDIGPAEPLGESSIALFRALGGSNPNPRTGAGVASGKMLYIVFPRSVNDRPRAWPMTQAEIDQAAKPLLDALGGEDVLEACAAGN